MTHGTAPDSLNRPVVILVGPSGSGKSEVAVNLAFGFKDRGRKVALIDLDTVKPYFRSRLVRDELTEAGVKIVIPEGDHLYADTPIISREVRRYLAFRDSGSSNPDGTVVIVDVGGNDNGARVVGSLAGALNPEEIDLLLVVNANRPLTGDVGAMADMVRDMSLAAGLEVTGLVSNTHLMDETTPEIVRSGLDTTRVISGMTGIPIRFYCVPELPSSFRTNNEHVRDDCPVLVLKRYILPPHARRTASGRASVL